MHHESPRIRRLRSDLAALDRVRSESSVFGFQTTGDPPHAYQITFKGRGLYRDRGKVRPIQTHRVEIRLGSSYPRTIPEIRWLTPIYHPNISEIGMVCLGGYGTQWAPSVQLAELCTMLWDMARYHNYDIRSPYNRDAALWAAHQTSILFPTDPRPIRDLRVAQGRLESETPAAAPPRRDEAGRRSAWGFLSADPSGAAPVARVRRFIERYGWAAADVATAEPTARDDEMVILESTAASPTVDRRQAEPSRGGDEILFIE